MENNLEKKCWIQQDPTTGEIGVARVIPQDQVLREEASPSAIEIPLCKQDTPVCRHLAEFWVEKNLPLGQALELLRPLLDAHLDRDAPKMSSSLTQESSTKEAAL